MSVNRTDYIVFGWKLPYELKNSKGERINFYDDDKYLPMIEGHPNEPYSLIIDGMSGDYIVFGKIIAEADDDEGWGFNYLTNLIQDPYELISKYHEVFDVKGIIAHPHLFIFSHFH